MEEFPNPNPREDFHVYQTWIVYDPYSDDIRRFEYQDEKRKVCVYEPNDPDMIISGMEQVDAWLVTNGYYHPDEFVRDVKKWIEARKST